MVADLRPQGLPVLTSTQSSLNHFLRAAPSLLFLTATFITPVFSTYLTAFGYSTRSVRRRPDLVSGLDLLCTSVVSFFTFCFGHYGRRVLDPRLVVLCVPRLLRVAALRVAGLGPRRLGSSLGMPLGGLIPGVRLGDLLAVVVRFLGGRPTLLPYVPFPCGIVFSLPFSFVSPKCS